MEKLTKSTKGSSEICLFSEKLEECDYGMEENPIVDSTEFNTTQCAEEIDGRHNMVKITVMDTTDDVSILCCMILYHGHASLL